jgi:DNA invertase Pin-like site-specific DNA recombinase
MQTYIYLRVSTGDQDQDSQLIGITNYCEQHNITKITSFKDTASGATGWVTRKLATIVKEAKTGDQLIVSELSRIGRSTSDVLSFLSKAAEQGLKVVAVKNNMTFDGSISSKIFSTVLALAAEIERDFIRQRTIEGMKNAKIKGVVIGRPKGRKSANKLEKSESKIMELVGNGVPKSAICRIFEVSRGTLDRLIKQQELK